MEVDFLYFFWEEDNKTQLQLLTLKLYLPQTDHMGFFSVCCEYVLLSLIKKEAD